MCLQVLGKGTYGELRIGLLRGGTLVALKAGTDTASLKLEAQLMTRLA